MTTRLDEIKLWLNSIFDNCDFSSLHYLKSDASSRKYLRLSTNGQSYIIMDSQPDTDLDNFVSLSMILAQHKLSVPKILQDNRSQGLLLLSDLGDDTYLNILLKANPAKIDSLYLDALMSLVKMQQIEVHKQPYKFKSMDGVYIADRLNVFKQWYLQQHLNLEADTETDLMVDRLQHMFAEAYSQEPQVFVHVDYHSRNIMYLPNNNPGIIDYQDAMLGPVTYDLVSLLQDAYITWPRDMVESLVDTYKMIAIKAGVLPEMSTQALLKSFDLVGLHRHLKNLGIFARLHHRDHKSGYLQDIPTLLFYIDGTCQRYPELYDLREFIKRHVIEMSL